MPESSTSLYPEGTPFAVHQLAVGDGHVLHLEESGNPEGVPVVVLHGGPGGGSKPLDRRQFDPSFWRVILFDQRGCGRSTPHAALAANTTWHLVADIERIREHLALDRWAVMGGSWGSCLALAYAQTHTERVLALRLHGIFLADRWAIDHWFKGIELTFPERYETFLATLSPAERADPLLAYYRRVTDPDPAVHGPAAVALRTFSAWTQTFRENPEHVARLTAPDAALAIARLFTHYCVNGAWLRPGQLVAGVDRIRHLPAEIVQGRYDVVTPMKAAHALARAWPEAAFTVVTEANHAAGEPALAEALVAAGDRLRQRLERSDDARP